jgi:membrane-bound lytic murein transglycosylase F
MFRRQTIKFFLSAALLMGACNTRQHEVTFATEPKVKFDLDEIKRRGYINALVDNNSFSYFIYKGTSLGYEYELLKGFANSIKIDLKIKVVTGLEEAFHLLNTGGGDVLAFPLTITNERKQYLSFTNPHFTTNQVLVQRKPDDWRANPWKAEKEMLRNPVDLVGKTVHVVRQSAYKQRLENLAEEIGGEIHIVEDNATSETESLIHKVGSGEIEYTVTDQMIARVNAAYNPDIDVNMQLSLPQQIAWGVRKNSPDLLTSLNSWLSKIRREGVFQVVYNRYFNSPRTTLARMKSDYSSLTVGKLSPYDEEFKKAANELGWDWRLLASIAYQESNFKPNLVSWAGAIGLMQIMPETGKQFKAGDLYDPKVNLNTSIKLLKYLDMQWVKTVKDQNERLKFILASYNVGLGHVIDARNLARKYGKNPTLWKDVEYFLLQKSNPVYHRDPVVTSGYCRCEGPVYYVKEVLQRYEEYKIHIG